MITVIIETCNDEEGLARTLASLVSAAVEGVVRDVIICDSASTDATRFVADHAGCVFLESGDLGAALGHARGEWVMFVEPGARLAEGWLEPVMAHAGQLSSPARFSRSLQERQSLFSRFFSARRPLSDGLVMTKRQAMALSKSAQTFEALARGVSTRRLDAQLTPAPVKKPR